MAATHDICAPINAGDFDAVRRLLDADPGLAHVRRAVAEDGSMVKGFAAESALGAAARAGQLEIVKLLIDAGADAAATDAEGKTAMDRAIERGTTNIQSVLRATSQST